MKPTTIIPIPQTAITLIKQFEGYRNISYKCPAGVWTIGYGSTRVNGQAVTQGMTCTAEQADEYLQSDLQPFARAIKAAVTVPITEDQFAALLSFVYNVGPAAFESSTLLKKLNNKEFAAAYNEFFKWTRAAGKVLTGLVTRRAAEAKLFGRGIAQ